MHYISCGDKFVAPTGDAITKVRPNLEIKNGDLISAQCTLT